MLFKRKTVSADPAPFAPTADHTSHCHPFSIERAFGQARPHTLIMRINPFTGDEVDDNCMLCGNGTDMVRPMIVPRPLPPQTSDEASGD